MTTNARNARERTPISDATAAQIRAERAAAGMSQEAVYTAAGISKSAYLKLESGRNVADVSQLAGICAALGLDLPTFFERAMARVVVPEESAGQGDDRPVRVSRGRVAGRSAKSSPRTGADVRPGL